MDHQKAIDNITDILIDDKKFEKINRSIFDAIDADNSGSLERDEIETFVEGLLKGFDLYVEDENVDFQERHKDVFSVLDDNESGEITLDELGRFLRELFKEQIKVLQKKI
mmetsp:Transcript_29666/g.45221  ORF Transcript_29666/g.45221 Transcript_29666/m.45221 type:complete len:110 (+) Transcript_29666:9-338(+)